MTSVAQYSRAVASLFDAGQSKAGRPRPFPRRPARTARRPDGLPRRARPTCSASRRLGRTRSCCAGASRRASMCPAGCRSSLTPARQSTPWTAPAAASPSRRWAPVLPCPAGAPARHPSRPGRRAAGDVGHQRPGRTGLSVPAQLWRAARAACAAACLTSPACVPDTRSGSYRDVPGRTTSLNSACLRSTAQHSG